MAIVCPQCKTENPDDSVYCSQCATALKSAEDVLFTQTKTLKTPQEDLTTGSSFAGRYQIIEELGKGGMGKVYRAVDTKLHEEVAIKLIKPEIASDEKTVERFGNELKIARKIVHKNVGRMYELMEEKGTLFITMEYVPGENLKSMIKMTKQLSVGTAVDIAIQICEGLSEAHRLGIVHRDLKPSNIMIDKEGNARIMDFGIARSLKAGGITGPGGMIGTPEYISPEQVEGKDIDHRSDIYSLGVILFEMLTGRLPFAGETILSIAMKHKSEKPPDPRKFNAQIPDDLSRLILKCMEKEKEKRHQNAEELLFELKQLAEAIPTAERVIPGRKTITPRKITASIGFRKIYIPALIMIALAAIAVIIWQVLPRKGPLLPPSDKPSLAIMYFKNNTGDASLDHWRTAITDLLITDLSQSKFIRVLSGELLFNILNQMNQLEAATYSSEVLREVAERGRADRVIVGHYTKADDTFRINISLQDGRTGELIDSESVEGIGERSFYSMVDELTRRIKEDFEFSEQEIASDIDEEVETITTSSPEAYKLYSEGRKYHLIADYKNAVITMQKVLEIDPEFAMAYRSLAMSYSNMEQREEKNKAIKKAFELSDRVSERERYIIEADYYKAWEKTYDKAMEAYKNLLNLYPEDFIGNTNSGILYFELEEFDKAVERYRLNIQNYPEGLFNYWNLTETYEAMGLYDKAHETIESYLNHNPDHLGMHLKQFYVYMYQGKYDPALSELEKILFLDPQKQTLVDRLKGDVYLLQDDLARAEQQYQKLPKNFPLQREGLVYLYLTQGRYVDAKDHLRTVPAFRDSLAYVYLRSGNPEVALKQFSQILERARRDEMITLQILVMTAMGEANLRMKSIDEAQRAADEIKAMIRPIFREKHMKYHDYLKGRIEFEKGKYSRAAKYLQSAVDSLYHPEDNFPKVHAWFLSSLAEAYFEAGKYDKARQNYEKIHDLEWGRLADGDLYAKSYYMLGQIFDEQGNKAKAIEHYETFIDFWKDADPNLPEVEDARNKLAALKGH